MPRHGGGRRPFRGGSPRTCRHVISAVTDDEHLFVCHTARDPEAIAVADVALGTRWRRGGGITPVSWNFASRAARLPPRRPPPTSSPAVPPGISVSCELESTAFDTGTSPPRYDRSNRVDGNSEY
jgi:hypothetical protein